MDTKLDSTIELKLTINDVIDVKAAEVEKKLTDDKESLNLKLKGLKSKIKSINKEIKEEVNRYAGEESKSIIKNIKDALSKIIEYNSILEDSETNFKITTNAILLEGEKKMIEVILSVSKFYSFKVPIFYLLSNKKIESLIAKKEKLQGDVENLVKYISIVNQKLNNFNYELRQIKADITKKAFKELKPDKETQLLLDKFIK